MKENMNNMQDFMAAVYDTFNIFPNRPIVMIDAPTLFTYGSIGITAVILAVATIYDEEPEQEQEPESDLANNNSPNETSSEIKDSSPDASRSPESPQVVSPQNQESVGGKNRKSKNNKKKRTKRNRH
jgi:hypothetical protein